MCVVKLTVFQLRQSVNVNIVFSSYIFDLVCTNEVFHWQATIMGPVRKFYIFESLLSYKKIR